MDRSASVDEDGGSMGKFQYMNRSYSTSTSTSDSGPFSECNSDRSGEFSSASASRFAHRLLASTASSDACYSDDAVRSLVSDLLSDEPASQRRAATEIRLLAKHSPENRLRIARAGAVLPLVSLLSSPDPQLQEQGVTAILNLSLCDVNKPLITAAGAIRPLVRALKTGTPVAKENAACALLRLSQLDENRVAIGRSGAVPLLVNLLETGTSRGKKDAATALYSLCSSSRENRIRASQAGVVRPLLELMADPESGMVDKAAYVLAAVSAVPEARAAVVAEGGMPVLVEIIEAGTLRQKEVAADVLLQVCEDSAAARAMAVRESVVPALVELSLSGTSRAKKKAEALIELLRQPRRVSDVPA